MRRHLNTLFVTTDGSYLSREGESVVVKQKGVQVLRVPAITLDGIVCMSRSTLSTPFLRLCAKSELALSVISPSGEYISRFEGPTTGNVLLRRDQYRIADSAHHRIELARSFVLGKLLNTRSLLLRAVRDRGDSEGKLSRAAAVLERCTRTAEQSEALDHLRGVEGRAAQTYFGAFDELIVRADTEFRFEGRSRRPPTDRVNAMLSFAYALLRHDTRSACEGVGLDPQVGFLHQDRPGRPGLALDLMEELRAPLADRAVLAVVNRRQVAARDFYIQPGGAVQMKDVARRALIGAFQKKKHTEITHPFLNEKTTIGLIAHLQARLLARCLRGDLDGYPPFIIR